MSTDVGQIQRNMIIVDREHIEAVACEGLTRFEGPCETHAVDARQGLREQRSLNRRRRVQIASDSAVCLAQLTFVASTLGDVSDCGDDQRSQCRPLSSEAVCAMV